MSKQRRVVIHGQSKEQRNTWTPEKSENTAALAETLARPLTDSLGCRGAAVSREVSRSFDPRTNVWSTTVLLAYTNGAAVEVDTQTTNVTIIRKGNR